MNAFTTIVSIGLFVAFTSGTSSVVRAEQATLAIAKLEADLYHTCALTNSGGVKCWGWNGHGALGDGTTTRRLVPVDTLGLTSGVSALALGVYQTCALSSSGGVKCWGWNEHGQLGDGTNTDRLAPVDVLGLLSGVSAITAGSRHACALSSGGAAKCWGHNLYGELGDGTTTDRFSPVDVVSLQSGVAAIAAGGEHTCALTTAGGVKCWGSNSFGQLGDGTQSGRHVPADVLGLESGIVAISSGFRHTCALTLAGGVKCWGLNFHGQLGDGTIADRLAPVNVQGLASGMIGVSAGHEHTCGLTAAGGVMCWGSNLYGLLGDGSTDSRFTPTGVVGLLSGTSAVTAGGGHTCALTTNGGAKCWGRNDNGQIGDGSTSWRAVPVDVVFSFNAEVGRTLVTSYYQTILRRLPDAAGLDYWTAEAARVASLGADVKEVFFAMAMQFYSSAEYAANVRSDAQYIADLYKTFFSRDPSASELTYWQGELTAVQSRSALLNSFLFSQEFSNVMTTLFGTSNVRPEVNMTMDLYRGSNGRLPDSAGFSTWLEVIRQAQCQSGSQISVTLNTLLSSFFNSAEYAGRARSDRDFLGDVYNAYLRRGPGGDAAGFNYWVGQLANLGRDGVRAQFVPSVEFQNRVTAVLNAGCLP